MVSVRAREGTAGHLMMVLASHDHVEGWSGLTILQQPPRLRTGAHCVCFVRLPSPSSTFGESLELRPQCQASPPPCQISMPTLTILTFSLDLNQAENCLIETIQYCQYICNFTRQHATYSYLCKDFSQSERTLYNHVF